MRLIAMTLAALIAWPVMAGEVLFKSTFDDPWDGRPLLGNGSQTIGGICDARTNCANLYEDFAFFRNTRCGLGECALSIRDGNLRMNLESGSSWANDGILSWWDSSTAHDEIWVAVDMTLDSDYSPLGTGGTPQIKVLRGSYYNKDLPIANYPNSPHAHSQLAYFGLQWPGGGNSTMISYVSPRCGGHNNCPGADTNYQRFFWNLSGARYCSTDRTDHCLLDSDCATGYCTGELVAGESNTNPARYGGSYQGYCSSRTGPRPCQERFTNGTPGQLGDGRWHQMKIRLHAGGIQMWQDGKMIHNRSVNWQPYRGWNHFGLGGNNFKAVSQGDTSEPKIRYDNFCVATSEDALDGCWTDEWVLPQENLRLCAVTRKGKLRVGTTDYCDDPLPGDISELGFCRFARWPLTGRRMLISSECEDPITEEIYEKLTR